MPIHTSYLIKTLLNDYRTTSENTQKITELFTFCTLEMKVIIKFDFLKVYFEPANGELGVVIIRWKIRIGGGFFFQKQLIYSFYVEKLRSRT